MLEKLKSQEAPETVEACHQDQDEWWKLFCLWARKNQMDESVDFVNEVDQYKGGPRNGYEADGIYREFLSPDAPRPVNIDDDILRALQRIYSDDPPLLSLEMFDPAYAQILGILGGNYQQRFVVEVRRIRKDLQAADAPEQDADVDGPHEIGAPAAREITRDHFDQATVDAFNQSALKELTERDDTRLYELDDLVVIQHPFLLPENQPLVKWISHHPGVHTTGRVATTAKGGAFSPGKVTVRSVQNQDVVEAAIGRVSKKKVVFA
jgi:hypothetical protein